MVAAFTVVIAIEAVIVDFLISVPWLRIVAVILAVYSVILIWGILAGERIRPHYLGADHLVLRRGRKTFATIPLAAIASTRPERTFNSEMHELRDDSLTLGGSHGTDTTLALSTPVSVAHDTWPWQEKRTSEVSTISLYSGNVAEWLPRPATNSRN
ncbi:hypothetical protein ACXZ66_12995 [Corynebacterium sp. S7]